MKARFLSRTTILMGVFVVPAVFAHATSAGQTCLSPTALVADDQGERIYVAEADAEQIAVFDTRTSKVTTTIKMRAELSGLALTGDGAILYVTCGGSEGCVGVVDTRTAKLLRMLPAGHTPIAPVLSPDGKFLYICNRFDNNIAVMSTADYRQLAKIPVVREPAAADITPDGKWLYVGNMLPRGSMGDDSIACNVSVINARAMAFEANIALPNGSTGLHGIVASPDGRFVFASHVLGRYTVPTTQLERGWINTNAISVIDAGRKRLIATVLLDDVDHGAANPWGLACTSDSKYLCVACAGTHELIVIEIAAMLDKIDRGGSRTAPTNRSN
jgi:DNA-binding beta-propeller fold protein YncE